MLRVEVWKNSITGPASNDGELETSTTTEAPFSAASSPSRVSVLTPVFGAAAKASWPCCRTLDTTLEPMRPVPPITTTFIAPASHVRRPRGHGFATAALFPPGTPAGADGEATAPPVGL